MCQTLCVLAAILCVFLAACEEATETTAKGDCGCDSLSRSSGLAGANEGKCSMGDTTAPGDDTSSDSDASADNTQKTKKEQRDEEPRDVEEKKPETPSLTEMVYIRGGYLTMGQEEDAEELRQHQVVDGESPERRVRLRGFYMDEHTVTNAQFGHFIEETQWQTDAEKYGWSFVFEQYLDKDHKFNVVVAAPWWVSVPGSSWDHPFGPESNTDGLEDHPVVHVSWNDATAYCKWAGKRLPTEAEHEWASRAGLRRQRYPWGNELYYPGKEGIEKHRCNIWQGNFPNENTGEDGYVATAPAKSFEPNAYKLYNMVGNVWEWVQDWWTIKHPTTPQENPTGPETGKNKVQRGGSYMCHSSYCYRYRTTARIGNEPDTSTGNLGFRCAKDK